MKYFLTCVRFSLQQRLGSLRNWIILLLLPMLVFSTKFMLPEENVNAPVCIGVVLPESGGTEMWELLEGRNDSVLSFILTDEDTLDRNIAAGRWDCGIILAEDFNQKVLELDTDRIFTLRIGPGSTVYPLIKETISSCMAQLIGPYIARDYLSDTGIANESKKLQLEDPDWVHVSMSTLDREPLKIPELTSRGTRDFLRWLICVSIMVRMLFGAADLGNWIHSPGMKRTQPLRSSLYSMTARGTADSILLFCSASAALLLLGEGFWSYIAVLSYILFWLMVSLLLAQFSKITTMLHVFIPFAVVISLLLSCVLMDISLLFPWLSGVIGWLPITMFLKICGGSSAEIFHLLIGGVLFLIPGWVVSLRRWKK